MDRLTKILCPPPGGITDAADDNEIIVTHNSNADIKR